MSEATRCTRCGYLNRASRDVCRNCGINLYIEGTRQGIGPGESRTSEIENEKNEIGYMVLPEKLPDTSSRTAGWIREQIAERGGKARDLTRKVSSTRKGIYYSLGILPELLAKTEDFLRNADEEFRERAYAPFLDNIEQAVLSLEKFNAALTLMESNAGSYKRLLAGKAHNFPPLEIQSSDIPDPARQTEHFRQLVRMGQRDIEFATIWEHRKTQRILLEGFCTLGEAVGGLSLATDNAFSRVTKTVEEISRRLREEQVRLRDVFEDAVRIWEEQARLYG